VSFDGLSDVYLKMLGKDNPMFFEHLWHSNIKDSSPESLLIRSLALNKRHPEIPRINEYRPIAIVSPLYRA
jgi:hypothetical protein